MKLVHQLLASTFLAIQMCQCNGTWPNDIQRVHWVLTVLAKCCSRVEISGRFSIAMWGAFASSADDDEDDAKGAMAARL